MAKARKLRVGVVDDNRSVAEIISEILGSRDFTCFDAYDGRGALELASREPLDLMILDYILPDMDGLSVVKKLESLGHEVPVLLVTGVAKDPPGGWMVSPLVKAIVRKPFLASELRAKVAEVTGRELP